MVISKSKRLLARLRRSKYAVVMAISVIITILMAVAISYQFLDKLEWTTYDLRFEHRGEKYPKDNIIILDVDQDTYSDLEIKWPYPMAYHAKVLERLFQAGAKVVCFDIIFDNISSKPQEDSLFAATIKQCKNVILAQQFLYLAGGEHYKSMQSFVRPNPVLLSGEPYLGFIGVPQEKDNAARRYQVINQALDEVFSDNPRYAYSKGELIAAMPLQAVTLFRNLEDPKIQVSAARNSIIAGNIEVPIEKGGRILINFAGPPRTFKTLPYRQIFRDDDFALLIEKSPGYFQNKIVLIGVTLKEFHDLFNTPFVEKSVDTSEMGSPKEKQLMPGVEIIANTIQTILDESYIDHMTTEKVVGFCFILSLICSFFTIRFGPRKGLLFLIFGLGALTGIAFYLFSHYNFWLNLIYPAATLLLTFSSDVFYHYMTEEREKQYIRKAFGHYLNPSVVEQLAQNPDSLKLGGQKRELTVMFSDIRGFTTLSESMDAEELTNFLNEYLTAMTDIILKNTGTVDKYMGDAIMAFWGAPLDDPNHAYRCCITCLEQMRKLHEMQAKWRAEGKHALDIGIGINTGDMTVGNMGSTQRFDYTVLGDSVNLGSRLEGTNKDYGTNIIMGERTYALVKDRLIARQLDRIRVKGKLEPVEIYEVIAEKAADLPEGYPKAYEIYSEGVRAYFNRDWLKAIECFQQTLDIITDDGPSQKHLHQCEIYRDHPPAADWDGVYIKTSK